MRNTHPNLYKTYMAYAVLSIALGLNFIYLTPTFMPLDMPKYPIGLAFLGCGAIKLTLLVLSEVFPLTYMRSWLRLSLSMSITIYSFWAGATTFDFFRFSQTSMQLPLMYMGAAVVGYILLLEPFTNPATEKNGNGKWA